MSTYTVKPAVPPANPIDRLEEVAATKEWRGERTTDHELVVQRSGSWCNYRMLFAWHEPLGAVFFSCIFDLRIPMRRRASATELLALINERLWLGHFELSSDELVPNFRHTVLARGGAAIDDLEELVDIAYAECERFYPAFQFMLWGGHGPRAALDAAILETVGEA